ncbi:MAG: hypothetical protein WBA67_05610, partial [Jannaschia sp.]
LQAPVALALNAACIYIGAAFGATLGGWVVAGQGLAALGIGGSATALAAVVWIVVSKRLSPVDSGSVRT